MGFDEPFFRQEAGDLVAMLLARESPWRGEEADARLRAGLAARLVPPSDPKGGWRTPSGRIEILNARETEPLPRPLPCHAPSDGFPLRLQPAATPQALNSSFYERGDLRKRQRCMSLMMNPGDAAARGLSGGEPVVAFNGLGEVKFTLEATARVPPGTVVAEGVWWPSLVPGGRGVNALTSQRLTDGGRGSTLYDAAVEVRRDENPA
jgi:anaerobic selenocysteine-containing dehydrogenase